MNLVRLLPKLSNLKTIVLMDYDLPAALKTDFDKIKGELEAAVVDVKIHLMSELIEQGQKNPKESEKPGPSDYFTICYTSGTTGLPKGAILTHENIIAVMSGVLMLSRADKIFKFSSEEVHISYLPLAHVFERVMFQTFLATGASIGFYHGDTLKLLDDVSELKPTVFASVPRLFNRIYDKVLAGVKAKGWLSHFLFSVYFHYCVYIN